MMQDFLRSWSPPEKFPKRLCRAKERETENTRSTKLLAEKQAGRLIPQVRAASQAGRRAHFLDHFFNFVSRKIA